MRAKLSNQNGFSLIELMIVVGIIGVLATMAVPKFSAFQAKAKQTEVKTTLNHIYTLQEAYFIDYSQYAGQGGASGNYGSSLTGTQIGAQCTRPQWAISVGFTLTPCGTSKPIYGYDSASVGAQYTATGRTGTDGANKLFPSCPVADIWTMNQAHAISQTSDGIANCN